MEENKTTERLRDRADRFLDERFTSLPMRFRTLDNDEYEIMLDLITSFAESVNSYIPVIQEDTLEWRDVKDYEGYYSVSNTGLVKSIGRVVVKGDGVSYSVKEKILISDIEPSGYEMVCLNRNSQSKKTMVHRLVAEAFIINPNNKRTVNHKDGNKLNNKASNLEWSTHSENLQHSFDTGIRSKGRGMAKFSNSEINEIRDKYYLDKCSQRQLAKLYNVPLSNINSIVRNNQYKREA